YHLLTSYPLMLDSHSCFLIVTTPTAYYTLSLHDALPIFRNPSSGAGPTGWTSTRHASRHASTPRPTSATPPWRCIWTPASTAISDRKSTRLNSSHVKISYAVFCLKKKITSPETSIVPYNR